MLRKHATYAFLHVKRGLIADLIRGERAEDALVHLQFSGKKAGSLFHKVLQSGMANASHNFNVNPADLYVKEVYVTGGPTLKRGRHVSTGSLGTYSQTDITRHYGAESTAKTFDGTF